MMRQFSLDLEGLCCDTAELACEEADEENADDEDEDDEGTTDKEGLDDPPAASM